MSLRQVAEIGDAYGKGALRVRMPAPRIDLASSGPSVSVVIPAKNEEKNLRWVSERMPSGVAEIILVDGSSTDGTVATAKALWPDVRVIGQNRRGKGNALACGFSAARSDIVVMIDADGSMDPGEIPYFVAALVAGADYAKGSRFAPGGGSSDITRVRGLGNRFLNELTGAVHKTTYTDLCYGYNAFWRRVLPVLDLDPGSSDDDTADQRWGDGFEVETLINIRVHLAGLKVTEVPSFETPRLHGTSNLNAVSDGLRVLRTIARENQRLRRVASTRHDVAALVRSASTSASRASGERVIDLRTPAERLHDTERGLAAVAAAADAGQVHEMGPSDLEVADHLVFRSHLQGLDRSA